MISITFTIMQASFKHCRALLALFIVLFSNVVLADPTGNFRYPVNGHSFDGNMLFSARVDDPDGLDRVVIRFNNEASSELLVCNCGNEVLQNGASADTRLPSSILQQLVHLSLMRAAHTSRVAASKSASRAGVSRLGMLWTILAQTRPEMPLGHGRPRGHAFCPLIARFKYPE